MSENDLPGEDLQPTPAPVIGTGTPPKVFDEEYVKKLRTENAKYRTERNDFSDKHANLLKTIAQKLGIDDPDTDPLTTIEKLKQENRTLKLSTKLGKQIKDAALNEKLVMSVLVSEKYFDSLDPDDPNLEKSFIEKLASLEKEHPMLKESPKIKTGGDFTEPKGKTGADMDNMLRRAAGY